MVIEKIIPGTKNKLKILRVIYQNKGINLTSLIKKVKSSPNSVSDYVNKLEQMGVLISTKISDKKAPVRNLAIDYASCLAMLFLSLVEFDRREALFVKYRRLRQLSEQLSFINGFALIYGSYARLSSDKESDIDFIVISDKVDKNRIKEVLITFPEVSLKIETKKQFLENLGKPLHANILKEGIVLINEIGYLESIRNYLSKN
ncbi:MAG: winged helix-turn-helix transcriptional regulator [Candidatus Pacearchaeota archaeon]|nr:winged helix-turn-helix transcriptional regulator [Candidatus Pacearchaeota archaeon]